MYKHKIRKVAVYARSDVFPTTEEAEHEQKIVLEINSKNLSPHLVAIQEQIKKRQQKIIKMKKREAKHHRISEQVRKIAPILTEVAG